MFLVAVPAHDVRVEPLLGEYSVGDVINCSANGSPAPTVSWRHVGGPVVSGASDGRTLTVSEEMRAGENVWKCVALNRYGSDELSITFNVTGELMMMMTMMMTT